MSSPKKIFIIEDEMIIAANISLQLNDLGYDVTGIATRGEEALAHIKINQPDIILLDIQLKGEIDGIETAKIIQQHHEIPIIYVTANVDQIYFDRAKETHPFAFISKPFKKIDLQRAIELVLHQKNANDDYPIISNTPHPQVLGDCIFMKHHDKMIKINIDDILYIEADRNYSKIITKTKENLVVGTLKDLESKLPSTYFQRVHRSYIINLSKIEEVTHKHIIIHRQVIPISKSSRRTLLSRLQTI